MQKEKAIGRHVHKMMVMNSMFHKDHENVESKQFHALCFGSGSLSFLGLSSVSLFQPLSLFFSHQPLLCFALQKMRGKRSQI
jgi:hypothetical protein